MQHKNIFLLDPTGLPMPVKHQSIISRLTVLYVTQVQFIKLLPSFFLNFHVDVAKEKQAAYSFHGAEPFMRSLLSCS
jgi:hypothetical protein